MKADLISDLKVRVLQKDSVLIKKCFPYLLESSSNLQCHSSFISDPKGSGGGVKKREDRAVNERQSWNTESALLKPFCNLKLGRWRPCLCQRQYSKTQGKKQESDKRLREVMGRTEGEWQNDETGASWHPERETKGWKRHKVSEIKIKRKETEIKAGMRFKQHKTFDHILQNWFIISVC